MSKVQANLSVSNGQTKASKTAHDDSQRIGQSKSANFARGETSQISSAEIREEGARCAAKLIVEALADLPHRIRYCGGVDGLLLRLTDLDREEIRDGLEAVVQLKAGLAGF